MHEWLLKLLFLRCRAAGNQRLRLDRSNDGCSRRNVGTRADDHVRNDGRARSDKAIALAGNSSGEGAARCNLDIILDDVVVINNRAGIDDGELPDRRSSVDDGPGHHDAAVPYLHVWGDHGGGVNKCDEFAAGRQDELGNNPTRTRIANGDKEPMLCSESGYDHLRRSIDFEIRRARTWIVIDEPRDGFSSRPRNVSNHATMGAAADDLYGSFQIRHDCQMKMPGLMTRTSWVYRHLAKETGLCI
jgi:hypothetical protein